MGNIAQISDNVMHRDADIYAQKIYSEHKEAINLDDFFFEEKERREENGH